MKHIQTPAKFKMRHIYMAVAMATVSMTAQAEQEVQVSAQQSVNLGTIKVNVERKLGRKSTEVTGLGKIIKDSESINKEQIMGIRDLTRYDPGISVVEQGRGATSGYSIRGVDKNRVGLQVDGLVQAQSYITEGSNANGGSINEIEYENVRSIELSKGSASAEFGSGALGGAVSFRTKEAKDVVQDGKWGVNTKTAYSSKNSQLANTVALATKTDKLDILAQFTHRTGKETKAHKAAEDIPQVITRLGAFVTPYELRPFPHGQSQSTEVYKNYGWFVLKEECPTLQNCTPKPAAERTVDARHAPRLEPAYTAKEQADYDAMLHPTEKVSAKDYTGKDRVLPDPMDYQSKSWLLKGGYHFTDSHYLGAVFENTQQQYDIQDKTMPAYITLEDLKRFKGLSPTKGIYTGSNINEGISLSSHPYIKTLGYAAGLYYDEKHDKLRSGLVYKYKNMQNKGLVDALNVSFDRQDIQLTTWRHEKRCSTYPNFDKNCQPTVDKPWSSYSSHRNEYQEIHNVFQLSADKQFNTTNTKHKINLLAGLDGFKSNLYRGDYLVARVDSSWNHIRGDGSYENPDIYERGETNLVVEDNCNLPSRIGLTDCKTRTITGYNQFIALRDHISMGKYVDLGLGVRYDKHQFKSDDQFTGTGKYGNWSYNVGLTVKPTDALALSYRHSNAFRVPAFYELFGKRTTFDPNNHLDVSQQYVSKLTPEQASNHEIGLGLKGDFGYFEISRFKNKYNDLITLAHRKDEASGTPKDAGYHNLQNITLTGVNVLGKIDWYGVSQSLPDGLYSTLAYNKIKVQDAFTKPGFVYTNSPLLDTLQPSRYVVGIGFDDPSDKWGVNLMATYSKAKNPNELLGQHQGGVDRNIAATKIASKHWYIYDITGYWNINQNFTLRGGVYNALNRKYSTWEAIRQSSINSVNQDSGTNSARYAAPGRNFNLALEMKF